MIGRKKMIVIGISIFALSSIATGLTSIFAVTILARCLTGVGAAFAAPNVWSYIGDYFPNNERGKVTAIVASALSLGMILGVPSGSGLAQLMNWEDAFYILGFIAVAVVICIVILLPKTDFTYTKQNYLASFKKVFQQRFVLFSFLATFFIAIANFGLYTFLGYWLNKNFRLSTSMVGLFLIIAGVGNLIGMQLAGILSDKFGRKKLVTISTLVMTFSLLLLPFLSSNIYLTGIDVFIWLASGGASFAVMQVIVTQLSTESRGTVMSLNNSFMWGGTASGSAIIGVTINNVGFFISALICSVSALLACLTLKFFIKENYDAGIAENKIVNS